MKRDKNLRRKLVFSCLGSMLYIDHCIIIVFTHFTENSDIKHPTFQTIYKQLADKIYFSLGCVNIHVCFLVNIIDRQHVYYKVFMLDFFFLLIGFLCVPYYFPSYFIKSFNFWLTQYICQYIFSSFIFSLISMKIFSNLKNSYKTLKDLLYQMKALKIRR